MLETKKIKVKILPKVSQFDFKGKTYRPGDVLEVPIIVYRPDFMEKVEPKPEPPVEKVEDVEPVVEVEKVEEPTEAKAEEPAESAEESSHVEISKKRRK